MSSYPVVRRKRRVSAFSVATGVISGAVGGVLTGLAGTVCDAAAGVQYLARGDADGAVGIGLVCPGWKA